MTQTTQGQQGQQGQQDQCQAAAERVAAKLQGFSSHLPADEQAAFDQMLQHVAGEATGPNDDVSGYQDVGMGFVGYVPAPALVRHGADDLHADTLSPVVT